MMPRSLSRPFIAAFALVTAIGASAQAAEQPQTQPTAESQGAAAVLDLKIGAELRRLQGVLDTVSADIVRGNQAMWEDWLRAAMKQGQAMVADKQGTESDLAEAAVAIREQRLTFLQSIKAQVPDGLRGGWGDGITEVLLQSDESGHAKLASFTHALGSRSAVCVVEGKVTDEQGGIMIVPDAHPDQPIHVVRKGVALSVVDPHDQPGVKSPYCQDGGKLAGQYFYIEGAEKIMPWLMN